MAWNILLVDSVTGRKKRSTLEETDIGGFLEVIYSVSGPSVTEFPAPSGATITADNYIEFERNGQGLYEGSSDDFQRDVGNNKVVSNYTIPQGSKVRLRVYQG